MNKNIYFEQVGIFLDKELSGDELTKFNEELSRNPELVKELNFQEELIEGINANRKAELKSRLDSITVGGGLSSSAISTIKIISGAVIIGAIGYTIFDFNKASDYESSAVVENTIPAEDPELKTNESIAIDDQAEARSEELVVVQTPAEDQVKSVIQEPVSEQSEDKLDLSQGGDPVVPVPMEAFEPTDESGTEDDLVLPESNLGVDESDGDSKLEVEIVSNKRKYAFHYLVSDGKIQLYGNFDEEPYELIEININEERKIFLYFKSKYYSIDKDVDQITPLQTVTDTSLTIELEKIRNKDS